MQKIFIILIAAVVFQSAVLSAQTFTWAKSMGGTIDDWGSSIALDASGNVYTTGYFQDTADFDPGTGVFNLTSSGLFDIFISKLDASGNFVWAKAIGGTGDDWGFSIVLDASGNVYTTGMFDGTADFDPGAGVFNLTSAGVTDIFISKLDASGNFVYAKSMGGTGYDRAYGAALDAFGNVYTTGFFNGTADFDPGVGVFNLISAGGKDVFISKSDASGNFVWAKAIRGIGEAICYSIAIDTAGSGDVYTTGYFRDTADFDPGAGVYNLTPADSGDIFISRLDASGNFIYAKSMGGINNDAGYSIVLDPTGSGNVYTTGMFNGTADFDPGAGVFNLTSAGNRDVFIFRLDAFGNFVYAKSMGSTSSDFGSSIVLDASGNVYTIGSFNGTVDFDPDLSVTFNFTSAGSFDIFISKLDASGNFVWAKTMGGTGTDYGKSIALDASSNVYTVGIFNGTADFDPGTGIFNLTSAGLYDIFVHELCQSPSTSGAIVGATTVCNGSTNNYSITAVIGATSYTWVLPGGWSGVSTTNSINATASATSGNITVTANNTCGSSSLEALAVTVNALPIVIFQPMNPDTVCITVSAFSLTGGSPAGGAYSGSGISAGMFNPSVAGTGTHTITYSYSDVNGCVDSASQIIYVDVCTGVQTFSQYQRAIISPNPSTGIFTIHMINGNTSTPLNIGSYSTGATINHFPLTIEIYNMMGEKVFSRDQGQGIGIGGNPSTINQVGNISNGINHQPSLTGRQALTIDLSSHSPGIYFIKVITPKNTYTDKLIIQ